VPLRRRLAAAIAALLAVGLLQLTPLARAASPASGSLSSPGDRVTWTGGPFTVSNPSDVVEPCASTAEPGCDRFSLTVAPQATPTALVISVSTADPEGDDYDLYVFKDGREVARSANPATPPESVAIGAPRGTYEVRVKAFTVTPGSTYAGEAKLVEGSGPAYEDEETFDEFLDCFEAVPERTGVRGLTDDGRLVSLDVTVLVDGAITEARAREVFTYARKSYEPLGIELNVTRYVKVDAPSDGTAQRYGRTVGKSTGPAAIEFAKSVVGGVRPPDSDVVYLLTDKELYIPEDETRDLLGQADCIGGVRYDDRAFAVGELGDDLARKFGPFTELNNVGAKTAAHEIGHLLGAHHHYFDCVEGIPDEETTEQNEFSPCTIMAPILNFGSITFGVLDGAVVRGHAFEYAAANDAAAAEARARAEAAAARQGSPGFGPPGYALLGEDGGIFTFGGARFHGSTGDLRLNQPVVGMAWTPTGGGYWIVARDGGIFTFGDAAFHGSTGGMRLNAPILGMESTPTGRGYWLVAADGGIFTFGDAGFFGSTGDRRLNAPVVGLGTTTSGRGYWLVAGDGGIFTFGDAAFHGSTGDRRLNEPVFDLAATTTDAGYWLVARDGGVFTFGDAVFHGSAAAPGNPPVVGLDGTRSGNGYWIANRGGGVFTFGDAEAFGDLRGRRLNAPIVGFAATP
jgi:hypothetical protein